MNKHASTANRHMRMVLLLGTIAISIASACIAKPLAAVSKTVSTPPTSPGSAAILSYDGIDTFGWSYYNSGDYDQNSEVNIADLTPLGVRFKQIGPFAPDSISNAIDSDHNGEINGADFVQIARYFQVRCSGYQVQFSVTGSAPWSTVADVSFAEGTIVPGNRLAFVYTLPAPAPGFYQVVPYDETTALGIASNVVAVP